MDLPKSVFELVSLLCWIKQTVATMSFKMLYQIHTELNALTKNYIGMHVHRLNIKYTRILRNMLNIMCDLKLLYQ